MLLGCGDVPDLPAPPAKSGTGAAGANDTEATIATESFEGTMPEKWWVEGVDASGSLTDETTVFHINQANGHLLEGDQIASRFTADEGEGDRSSGRLVLMGNVRITSEQDGIVLTAEKLTYSETDGLIYAEGNVLIDSKDWMSGPFAKLVATPDLKRFGTPDRFGL